MGTLGDTLVVGLGVSGVAAATELLAMRDEGLVTSVTVVDTRSDQTVNDGAERMRELGASVHLGVESVPGHFDLAVASPGLAPDTPVVRWAAEHSAEIVSEIELAWRLSRSPWVAVTGTNGKTTTTAMIGHLLSSAGAIAQVVGNIGVPAIGVARGTGPSVVLVAEVSSFQLALTTTFKPRVAVLLNVTPDHLDWHGTMERYAADKGRIFANLGADDTAIIDIDDPGSAPFAERLAGMGIRVERVSASGKAEADARVEHGALVLSSRSGPLRLLEAADLNVRGEHNYSNALAAALAARALGVPAADIAAGLRSFAPIEHRLEPAGTVDSVEYFNDSKATNPDAVVKALGSFPDRQVVLLLGGRNKGNDFTRLAVACAGRCRAAIVFGEAQDEIANALSGAGVESLKAPGLRDAVERARGVARAGDAVVLSPACASFDEFADYEERGRAFKGIVSKLMAGSS